MTTIRKITIPNPCHQPWQEMTPNADGRHCDHCAKTVVDFANLTDAELISYLVTHNNVCGRFSEPQLVSVNSLLDNQGLKADTGWKKWLMTMALLGSTLFYKASGQITPVTAPKVEQSPVDNYTNGFALGKIAVNRSFERKIEGRVLDDDCKPLHGATIRVVGTDIALPTDSNGKFQFYTPGSSKQLTVSFVGFETKTIAVDSIQNGNCEVKLTPHVVSINDVIVVSGYPSHRYSTLMGSVTTVTIRKHSWWWRMYYRYIRQPLHEIFG